VTPAGDRLAKLRAKLSADLNLPTDSGVVLQGAALMLASESLQAVLVAGDATAGELIDVSRQLVSNSEALIELRAYGVPKVTIEYIGSEPSALEAINERLQTEVHALRGRLAMMSERRAGVQASDETPTSSGGKPGAKPSGDNVVSLGVVVGPSPVADPGFRRFDHPGHTS